MSWVHISIFSIQCIDWVKRSNYVATAYAVGDLAMELHKPQTNISFVVMSCAVTELCNSINLYK